MKKSSLLLAVLMSSAAVFSACGSSEDEGPLDRAALVSEADGLCSEANLAYDDLGVRGVSNTGVAAEMSGTVEISEGLLADLQALEVDAALQEDWDAYLAAFEKTVNKDHEIVAAAEDEDTEAVNAGFTELGGEIYKARQKAADALGFKVCSQDVDIKVEPTGTGPADDLTFAEPKNTVDEAATAWIAAAKSGDCARLNKNIHTDGAPLNAQACKSAIPILSDAKVVATEQYGPVGVAELVSGGGHYPTLFVSDLDGRFRYAADLINDNGGLRPAGEDNDAEQTAEAALKAIVDGDSGAFNETVFEPEGEGSFKVTEDDFDRIGAGKYGPAFVKDVRTADGEFEPLGINATWAFYLVEGEKNDWIVNLVHAPGAGQHYKFSGYWPTPKAE